MCEADSKSELFQDRQRWERLVQFHDVGEGCKDCAGKQQIIQQL